MEGQTKPTKTGAGISAQMSEDAANSGRRGGDNRSPLHVASSLPDYTATTTATTMTATMTTATTTTTTTTMTATTKESTHHITRQDAVSQSGDTLTSTNPLMDLSALEESLLSQDSSDSEMDTETEESLLKETDTASQPKESKKRKSAKQVAKSGYKSSVKFLKKMDSKEVSALTDREKRLIKKHKKIVRTFEKRYGKVTPSEALTTSAPLPATSDKEKEETKETGKGEKRLTKTNQALSTSTAGTFKTKKGKAKETEKGEKRPAKATQAPSTSKVTEKLSGNSTGKTKPAAEPKIAKSEGRHMATSNPKRIRSADDETAGNSSKKVKTGLTSSEELTLAVIDRSDPDGKLSKEKWLRVEAKILEAMLTAGETADAENICKFDGAGWRKGVKVVGCSNKESHDFLTSCIRNLGDLWPGAKIEAIPAASLPLRELVHVWVPPPVLEVNSILRLISMQNKGLCTGGWQVLSSKPREKGGLDLKIVVDRASAAAIRAAAGVVKFGLGSLKFIISSNEGSRKAKGGAN